MSKKEITTLTDEQLAILNSGYPVSESSSRESLPRFGMLSKDLEEESGSGKNKIKKVIESAGTFYTEKDLGEVDEKGKKVWTKEFLGSEVDVIIAFHRKQLRLFDKSLKKFISSPLYDNKEQIISLYLDKRQIAKGNQETLQALYPAMSEKGKKISKLKEETVLFVIYRDELYQCSLSQSSKWSFKDYGKKLNPSTVVTRLGSLEETNGSNTYSKMTFKSQRLITPNEFELVNNAQSGLKEQVESDARYFLEQAVQQISQADKDLDMIADASSKLD